MMPKLRIRSGGKSARLWPPSTNPRAAWGPPDSVCEVLSTSAAAEKLRVRSWPVLRPTPLEPHAVAAEPWPACTLEHAGLMAQDPRSWEQPPCLEAYARLCCWDGPERWPKLPAADTLLAASAPASTAASAHARGADCDDIGAADMPAASAAELHRWSALAEDWERQVCRQPYGAAGLGTTAPLAAQAVGQPDEGSRSGRRPKAVQLLPWGPAVIGPRVCCTAQYLGDGCTHPSWLLAVCSPCGSSHWAAVPVCVVPNPSEQARRLPASAARRAAPYAWQGLAMPRAQLLTDVENRCLVSEEMAVCMKRGRQPWQLTERTSVGASTQEQSRLSYIAFAVRLLRTDNV